MTMLYVCSITYSDGTKDSENGRDRGRSELWQALKYEMCISIPFQNDLHI